MEKVNEEIVTRCLICKKEIFRTMTHSSNKTKRAKKWVTCSRPCSAIYSRVRNHIQKIMCDKCKEKNEKRYK